MRSTKFKLQLISSLQYLFMYLPVLEATDSENARTLVIYNGGIIKLIAGLAMPIELPVSLLWVQNLQFQYPMIDNAAQLSYLNLLRSSKGISLTRNEAYKLLADTWDRLGVNGTACVLRIICEVSRYSSSHMAVLGTILRTIFTPHTSTDPIYLTAVNGNCKSYRTTCRKNISNIYTHGRTDHWKV